MSSKDASVWPRGAPRYGLDMALIWLRMPPSNTTSRGASEYDPQTGRLVMASRRRLDMASKRRLRYGLKCRLDVARGAPLNMGSKASEYNGLEGRVHTASKGASIWPRKSSSDTATVTALKRSPCQLLRFGPLL
ncbi:MAG: hypothetical protein FRX48_07202 [Lasallia pustulata]|uniref:Uncharacterized protein n=1 Tax=Lasallia pustulata TaxID=136370 RepID=A0A5M8PIQ4_9LECA|nr:MAG: hypothetical protein FRX48_07202 [Lasallia pustulata]